jgi:hypothetical protein
MKFLFHLVKSKYFKYEKSIFYDKYKFYVKYLDIRGNFLIE